MKAAVETTGLDELLQEMRRRFGTSVFIAEVGVDTAAPVRQPKGKKAHAVGQRSAAENVVVLRTQQKKGRDPTKLDGAERSACQRVWLEGINRLLAGDEAGMDAAGESVAAKMKSSIVQHIDAGAGIAEVSPRWRAIKKAMYGQDLPTLVASGQLRAAIITGFSKRK